MYLLDCSTAVAYLVERGLVEADEAVSVELLAGGVSNAVLLVRRDPARGASFVLKQARPQLRVPLPWFCPVERMWREMDVLRVCERLVAETPESPSSFAGATVHVTTPRMLYEDRPNYALAMTAAPVPHRTWKQCLLAGDAEPAVAEACGRLLGWLHARTWQCETMARELDDRQFFDALRIDPYYRQIALVHGDLKPAIERLIEQVWCNRWCLVHGDYSPKNLLVWEGHLMLIDFEVGHYGDPAFDLGFLFSHLILKSYYHGRSQPLGRRMWNLAARFWQAYRAQVAEKLSLVEWREYQQRIVANVGGCCLARVDGKSRVDYLSETRAPREFARSLLVDPPADWEAVLATAQAEIE